MSRIALKVNNPSHLNDADPSTPLLYILRNEPGLNGPRFGRGLSQCGARTVIMDNKPIQSCPFPSALRKTEISQPWRDWEASLILTVSKGPSSKSRRPNVDIA